MFESLKKKLGTFFKKEESEDEEESKKASKKTSEKIEKGKSKTKQNKKSEKKRASKQEKKKEKEQSEPAEEKSAKKETTPKEKSKKDNNTKEKEKKQEIQEEPIEEEQTENNEAEEEEEEEEEIEKKENTFFSKLKSSLTKSKLTGEQFETIFDELELTLLENNVALDAVDKIKNSLEKSLVGIDIKKSEIESKISTALKEAISEILIEPENLLERIKESEKPFTIVLLGINGTGKTTTIAKLANYLEKNKLKTILAAADTFRAASIEQLETHANKLGVPVQKSNYGSDPASVAFEAKKQAKEKDIDVVLIDTAGRMYTDSNLMREIEKICRVAQPDLKLFVGESITGNDAIEQAKAFNKSVSIDGSILTKADIDEKGGAALSIAEVTNKPIYFLGTGQKYEDFEQFSKDKILEHLGLD